jgi:CheY-like chemotaxis protein/signal transduction histidine kinase
MGSSEHLVWMHTAAAVAWGTVGGSLLRSPRGQRPNDPLLGTGLLVGAALTAMDSTLAGRAGLPLAGIALLATAALALGSRSSRVATSLVGLSLVGFGAALLFLLHWAHTAFGWQPALELGTRLYPLDLAVALSLAWLGFRGAAHDTETRFLVLTTAAGLAATSASWTYGSLAAAFAQLLAIVPLLVRGLRSDLAALSVATATAAAVGFTCALRATAEQAGRGLRVAGLDDPLAVVAIVFAVFGAALLRAYRTPDDAVAAPSPAAPQTPAPAPPPGPHLALPEHDLAVAAAVELPTTPEPAAGGRSRLLTVQDVVRDLRDPVTNIVAAGNLLLGDADTSRLRALHDYGQQLMTALSDIDDFEQLLRGSLPLVSEPFELPPLLESVVDATCRGARERGVDVRLDLAASLPRWTQGDAHRCRQLLRRLLQLVARLATAGVIDIAAHADEKLHVVVLHRDGPLPCPDQSLALSFCHQLALLLGGELQARVLGDAGLEFHLSLPHHPAPQWEVALVEQDRGTSAAAPADTARVQGKVLLVEDSRDHQLLVGKLLGRLGVEPTVADQGHVALHLLGSETYDLILMDLQLPDLDGCTTVRMLRDRGITTPVVALTADTSPADVERALAAGCNGHLGKPIDVRELGSVVAMHLRPAVR